MSRPIYTPYLYLWNKCAETSIGQLIFGTRSFENCDEANREAAAMAAYANLNEGKNPDGDGLRYLGGVHLSILLESTNTTGA